MRPRTCPHLPAVPVWWVPDTARTLPQQRVYESLTFLGRHSQTEPEAAAGQGARPSGANLVDSLHRVLTSPIVFLLLGSAEAGPLRIVARPLPQAGLRIQPVYRKGGH